MPAAARRRTEVHRVRAVRQEQHRNRKKEPLKTYPKAPKGATNYDKLCKTNPITKRLNMNITKVLTKDYGNKRLFRRAKNKPKQTHFQIRLTQNFSRKSPLPPSILILLPSSACRVLTLYQTKICLGAFFIYVC